MADAQALDVEDNHSLKKASKGGPISALPATLCGLGQVAYLSIAALAVIFFFIVLPVVLTLPQVVSCHSEDEGYYVVIISPPSISNVEPSMICLADSDRRVTVRGSDFLNYNGATPSIIINNQSQVLDGSLQSCSIKDVRGQDVQLCSQFQTVIRNQTITNISYFPLILTNPVAPEAHPVADVTKSAPCDVTARGLLTVVPPAIISDVYPIAICSATNSITISGEWFLTYTSNATGNVSKPLVNLNSDVVSTTKTTMVNSTCLPFQAHNYFDTFACDQVTVAINANSFASNSAVLLEMKIPEPLNCSADNDYYFAVVSKPTIISVSPNVVCNRVSETLVTLQGSNFLKVDGQLAMFSLVVGQNNFSLTVVNDTGCTPVPLPLSSHLVSLCSAVVVSVPAFAAPSGLSSATISVVSPDTPECRVEFSSLIYFAPEPAVASIEDSFICQGTQSNVTDTLLTIKGRGYSYVVYNSMVPAISVNGVPYTGSQSMQNCSSSVSVSGTTVAQICETMVIAFNYSQIQAMNIGPQRFTITQPAPISCSYVDSSSFNIIGPAVIYSISPSTLCAGELNLLILNGSALTEATQITLVMGNSTLYPTEQNFIDVNRLSVAFDPEGLVAGVWQLVAVNPGFGCSTPNLRAVTVKPKLFIFFVDPPVVYNGIQVQATVYTSGTDASNPVVSLTFSRIASGFGICSDVSRVTKSECEAFYTNASCTNTLLTSRATCEANNTWNGTTCTNSALLTQAQCTRVNLWTEGFCSEPTINATACTQQNAWTPYAIGSCSNPVLKSVSSCSQQNQWIAGACTNTLLGSQAECETNNTWTFYSPGYCSGGNSSTYEECVNQNGTWIATNTSEIYTTFTIVGADLVQRGSNIQVIVPLGLAVGDWQITIVRQDGCQSSLEGGVAVVSRVDLALLSVNPTRAWYAGNTAVTLRAPSNLTAPEVNFRSTPRVFLAPSKVGGSCRNSTGGVIGNITNPVNCTSVNGTFVSGSALGVSLAAVVFVDSTTLQGIIQSSFCSGPYTTKSSCQNASETWTELSVGSVYDLIAINPPPRSEVGVLSGAVIVVNDPPPTIRSVSPDYVTTGSATVTVTGINFLYPATAQIMCTKPGNADYNANSTSITPVDPTSFTATFVFPGAGSYICMLQVVNSDGSSFVYSSVTTLATSNINPFVVSGNLLQGRRGAEIVIASPAATQRFMYVIGGDTHESFATLPTSGLSSVEYAPTKFDGTPGASFVMQRYPLPAPVSHGRAAVVGRYIYYLGGFNTGTNQTSSAVYRAQVLDPLKVPTMRLALNILGANASSDLTAGLWYYRVSAVFANSSTTEYEYWSGQMGSGETLPSESLSIRLPDLKNMQLSLTWDAFPGASQYRLYRSPKADRDASQLGLVYQGSATNFQDIGGSVDLTQTPLPLGHLSHWAVVSTPLSIPRARFGFVVVPPTPANPLQTCLFAIGGATAWSDASANATIGSYCATVAPAGTLSATETHSIRRTASAYSGAFGGGWGYDAALITSAENPQLTNGRRMLFMSTRLPSNTEGSDVHVIEVYLNATLAPNSYATVATLSSPRHGGFFNSVGGEAFGIGGMKSGAYALDGASNSWVSATATGPSSSWNNYGGGKLVSAAAYFAKIKFGPFLIVAGGCDGTQVLKTVQTSYCCS